MTFLHHHMLRRCDTLKRKERGKLVHIGETGNGAYDSIKGAKIRLYEGVFMLFVVIVLAIESLRGNISLYGSNMTAFYIWSMFIGFFAIALYGWAPEVDGIYENGLTAHTTLLITYLRDRSFHPFEEITKIGYGERQTSVVTI